MPAEIKRLIVNHCGPVLMGYKPAAMFMLRSEDAYGSLSGLLPACLELMVLRKSEGGLLVLVFEKEKLEKTLLEAIISNENIRAVLAGKGYPLGACGAWRKSYEEMRDFTRIGDPAAGRLLRFAHKIPKNRRLGDFLPYNCHQTKGSQEPGNRDFCGTKHRKNPPVQQAPGRMGVCFGFLDRLKEQFTSSQFPHEVGIFLGYPADDVLGFVEHNGQNYKLCGYWKVYGDVERAKACFRQYDECRERIQTLFQ
ncbi:MAG: DUF3793 family protein [Treponema sp.]|jgi:hypothetical protein|nr:DUF3793 family protein [Treponema sp.]